MTTPGGARRRVKPSRRPGVRADRRGQPPRGFDPAGTARWSGSGSSEHSRRGMRRASIPSRIAGGTLALVCLWIPGLVHMPPDRPDDVIVSTKDSVVTAHWTGREVDSYTVEYADNPRFEGSVTTTVDDPRVELTALDPGTTYYLRVRTVAPDGRGSSPSQLVRFDTVYPNDAPEITVASNTSTSMSMTWNKAIDGGRYEAQVSTTTDFARPSIVRTIKTTKKIGGLAAGTLYAVRVRVIDDAGDPLSRWSQPAMLTTASYEPMGVATYNVLKWTKSNWSARRHAVADLIRSSHVDVVGLQEATPAHVKGGPRQFQDIENLLGSDWALTRSTGGPTGETRTVYDRTKLTLVQEGYQPIAGSSRFRGVVRYAAWAVFEQRSTGKRFVFVNTHFPPGDGGTVKAHRTSAARQLVDTVKQINSDGLPVVIVGDFNASGYRNANNGVYRTITGAGYVDPLVDSGTLGQAEKVVDGDLKTVNGMRRTAPRRSPAPFIDHIFVSPMRVSQWQVVANLDRAGRFIGTIPSDHNLVRATIYLP